MVTFKDRRQMRQELVSQGFAWEYIDEWQPKTTLFRHAPGLDMQGNEAAPVGAQIKGVPGNPDYVLRKARLGMYPYPPNEGCQCRWCSQRAEANRPVEVIERVVDEYACPEEGCEFIANGEAHRAKLSSLRLHNRYKH